MNHRGETQRIWERTLKIASEEQSAFLKSLKVMPPEFRERVSGVTIRFEERPGKEMIDQGVHPEALSLTERDEKGVVLFLMNLYDKFGRFPGDFRRELRRVMMEELADLAGMEWMGEDSP